MSVPTSIAGVFPWLCVTALAALPICAHANIRSTMAFLDPAPDSQDATERSCYSRKEALDFDQVFSLGELIVLRNNKLCVAGISENFCATFLVRAKDCEIVMEFRSSARIAIVGDFDSLALLLEPLVDLISDGKAFLRLLRHPAPSQEVVWAPVDIGDLFIVIDGDRVRSFGTTDRRSEP